MATHANGAAQAAPTMLRRITAAIEPWYNWGIIHIERMEGSNAETMNPSREGPLWFVELQWFGLHIGMQIGLTPKQGSR